jgi:hypothetical protein
LEKAPQIVNAKNRNPNRRFQFHKRSQLFIRAHNETLSVIAMGVSIREAGSVRSPAALLLQIPPSAVKSALPRFDLLLALWRDGKPMLLSRVPVQIAILDCLANLQKPRTIWRSWFCFSCFSHTIP